MRSQAIAGVLLSGHKEDAVEAPFDPAEHWGVKAQSLRPGRRGFPVHATLGKTRFETAIVARSKKFWLLIPLEASAAAKVSVGDSISVTVAPLT